MPDAPGGITPPMFNIKGMTAQTTGKTFRNIQNDEVSGRETIVVEQEIVRERILAKCDLLEALLTFNYSFAPAIETQLRDVRQSVWFAGVELLRPVESDIDDSIGATADEFECLIDPWKFLEWCRSLPDEQGALVSMPLYEIRKFYFSNFAPQVPNIKNYAPHTRVAIDIRRRYSKPGFFRYWLPEATLYEDMAISYNEAAATEIARGNDATKRQGKLHSRALRGAVSSAFYFVEAYINGISFDFLVRNESRLDQQTKDLITEWDSNRNCQKWLKFEHKLIKYPAAILGVKHSPLQASNCPEMKILITAGKQFRDAINHQSPMNNPLTLRPEKVMSLLELNIVKTREIVDAAVAYVRILNGVLGGDGIDLSWLHERQADGLFPEAAWQ
jgi:hypothetical protein